MQFRHGNIIFAKEEKYGDAIYFYERTKDAQRALGSERILDLSSTLHNYGIALYKTSQHKLALAAYEKSLCIAKSKLGSDYESIAETLYCIGKSTVEHWKQTKPNNIFQNYEYDAAMTTFKDVLQISKLSSSGETLVVATALHCIANIHEDHS